MIRKNRQMVPLQAALPSVVAELLRSGPVSDQKIAFAWQSAVGTALARATTTHLEPRGVLRVSAVDERWRREVRRSAPAILARIQDLLGRDAIRRIDVSRA